MSETEKAQAILDEGYEKKLREFAEAFEKAYAPITSILDQVEWAEKRVIIRRKFKGKRVKLRKSSRIYLNTPPPPRTFSITPYPEMYRYDA